MGLIRVLFCIIVSTSFNSCWLGDRLFNSYPDVLSEKVDTIEVSYISWACACANWQPTKLNGVQIEDSITDESCIFIEAGPSTYQVSEEIYCCSNRVRLIGSFYEVEGISRDYI